MGKRTPTGWAARLIAIISAATALSCFSICEACENEASDKFEIIRAYIQTWLSEASSDRLIISSSHLKEKVVEKWDNQSKKYQIVSVRKPADYKSAGHIPNAINIYWTEFFMDENLSRLDSNKIIILYCYHGNASMFIGTVLNLLGYKCNSIDFGMMDWNLNALAKKPWDQTADYKVEKAVNRPTESYPAPVLACDQTETKSIIKEMARKYLAGNGSPVIRSPGVKAIVDDWEHKSAEYQIVDVRSARNYETGHVPNAINIPWAEVAEIENLKKLDPHRTVIVCSDNGQFGHLATTVLNLLGYHAVNMVFGMMDWNKAYVDSHNQWDGAADYPIEHGN